MGTIAGTFLYNNSPMNGGTAKLWNITAFASYADSGDAVQDNPLSATAIELNVSDGGNFAVGNVLKAESECMLVFHISTNKLYVIRGWHGTTAASHVQTTVIYIETITHPAEDDSEPGSGQEGSSLTTGVGYGGDGGYRWTAIDEGEYYASVEYDNHRAFFPAIVERNDPTLQQILRAAGDIPYFGDGTVKRLPAGSNGLFLKMEGGVPVWSAAGAGAFTDLDLTDSHQATANATWEDWDISGIVPAGTVMVLLWIELGQNGVVLGVRGNGSSDDRKRTMYTIGGNPMISVVPDVNRVIEIYDQLATTSTSTFRLVGYWT